MIILQSAIVCKEVQSLLNGNLNFIDITNEFWGMGIAEFDLALSWITEKGTYHEKVTLTAPSGEIIALSENTITVEGNFHTSIVHFDIDFESIGIYYMTIEIRNEVKIKIPIIVHNIDS